MTQSNNTLLSNNFLNTNTAINMISTEPILLYPTSFAPTKETKIANIPNPAFNIIKP